MQTAVEDELLVQIRINARVVKVDEEELRRSVGRARARGITWNRIADALGVTRQSASERFG